MRIIVFGAGGFIGGWICEELSVQGGFELIACVRKWASAVRLARRGISIHQADLNSTIDDLCSIVTGADVVVNAAMPPPEYEAELAARLYTSCTKGGVKRVIQFSSIAVYGGRTGEINEETIPTPNNEYGRGKVAMERRLAREALSGGPTLIILRPSIVYGPFSDNWTVRFAQRIAKGRWLTFGNVGFGTCNLVHGHDIARAVAIAATINIDGKFNVFNINGPHIVTWNEYLKRFGDALEITNRLTPSPYLFYAVACSTEPVRITGKFAMTHLNKVLKNIQASGGPARKVMRGTESLLKLYPSFEELKLLRLEARYSWAQATHKLKFQPTISLEEGLRQSARWCRIHGVI